MTDLPQTSLGDRVETTRDESPGDRGDDRTAAGDDRSTPQWKQGGGEEGRGAGSDGAAELGGGEGFEGAEDFDGAEPLVTDAASFQRRWDSIKVGFVDDPRRSVAEAEALLGEVVDDMLEGFRRDRQHLEQGWERGDEGSTEHLRRALRRYMSFYERLLQQPQTEGGSS